MLSPVLARVQMTTPDGLAPPCGALRGRQDDDVRPRESAPAIPSSEIESEQTVQFGLDLGVRGLGARRGEVDDQPRKAPVGHPAPYLTELGNDAVHPLKIRGGSPGESGRG